MPSLECRSRNHSLLLRLRCLKLFLCCLVLTVKKCPLQAQVQELVKYLRCLVMGTGSADKTVIVYSLVYDAVPLLVLMVNV